METEKEKFDYLRFDKWVKEGMDLFGENKKGIMYSFLYGIKNFAVMPNSEFRILIFERLKRFEEKNIKQITAYDITNLRELVSEIKDNIITNSPLSIYFLINSLSERICDGLISSYGKDILDDKKEEIADKIKKQKYSMGDKINYVKEIISKKGTEEGNNLVKYLELLQNIRNKFIFHFLDNDEYFFVYSDERKGEKEENLKSIFQKILDKITPLLESLDSNEHKFEHNILVSMNNSLKEVIQLLEEHSYEEGVFHSTTLFYRDFSENFVYIAYAFLLFLGRDNLKLFKD